MNPVVEKLKALYGRNGGVCRPDTETPAGKAGAQEEPQLMKQDATGTQGMFNTPAKDSIHTVLKEGRRLITPNLAQRILDEANFSGQRPIARHHVKLLTHIMQDRRWQSGGQLAFCRLNGFLMLTNGQHRMQAVVDSGIAQEFQILITQCDTLEQVEADYHRHDIIARKRSVAEIMTSTTMGQESGLPKAFLSKMYDAASILSSDLQYVNYASDPARQRDVDYRLAVVSEWIGEARLYNQLIQSAPAHVRSKLINAGVMAVALVTIRYQPAKASLFWRGIAEDDGLRKGDPRKTLLQDFDIRKVNSGAHLQRVVPAITAWNAFYENRNIQIIRVSEASLIVVRGTPINEKEAG